MIWRLFLSDGRGRRPVLPILCQQQVIDTSCFPVSRDFCPACSRSRGDRRRYGTEVKMTAEKRLRASSSTFRTAVVTLAGGRVQAAAAGVGKTGSEMVNVCVFTEGGRLMWSGRRQRVDETRMKLCVARSKEREMTQ